MNKRKLLKKTFIILISLLTITLSCILFLYFYINRPPHRAFLIKPVYKLNTDEKVIALTFDDGPSDIRTPPLLDLLKRYGVKATFFTLGWNVEAYPEIAQRITEEGHLIGNHSYDHPRLYLKTPRFIRDQIEKTDLLIQQSGIQEVKYFRPPYCSKMIILPIILKAMDKKLVTCSYDPMAQYNQDFNGETVADQVIENAFPGVIVCLHDGRSDHPVEFVKAIEKIIIHLKEKGYTFVTVDYGEHQQSPVERSFNDSEMSL